MSKPPPVPRATGSNLPLLVVVGVLGAVALLGRRPEPLTETPVVPPGWLQIRQPGAVLGLAIDGDTVWAGGKLGLHRLDRRSGAWLGQVDVAGVRFVRALVCDVDRLWIAHDGGLLWLRDGETGVVAWPPPGPRRVNVLARDADGTLLAGLADGLYRVRDGRLEQDQRSRSLVSPVVDALLVDTAGRLWCGSSSDPEGGVVVFARDGSVTGTLTAVLPHRYINDLVEFADGTVWIATGQGEAGGVAIVGWRGGKPTVQRTLTIDDGLAGAKARVVFQDRDGGCWVGSENDGLALLGPGSPRIFREPDGLSHREVTCHLEDRDGQLWLGGLRGVTRLARSAVQRAKGLQAGS